MSISYVSTVNTESLYLLPSHESFSSSGTVPLFTAVELDILDSVPIHLPPPNLIPIYLPPPNLIPLHLPPPDRAPLNMPHPRVASPEIAPTSTLPELRALALYPLFPPRHRWAPLHFSISWSSFPSSPSSFSFSFFVIWGLYSFGFAFFFFGLSATEPWGWC